MARGQREGERLKELKHESKWTYDKASTFQHHLLQCGGTAATSGGSAESCAAEALRQVASDSSSLAEEAGGRLLAPLAASLKSIAAFRELELPSALTRSASSVASASSSSSKVLDSLQRYHDAERAFARANQHWMASGQRDGLDDASESLHAAKARLSTAALDCDSCRRSAFLASSVSAVRELMQFYERSLHELQQHLQTLERFEQLASDIDKQGRERLEQHADALSSHENLALCLRGNERTIASNDDDDDVQGDENTLTRSDLMVKDGRQWRWRHVRLTREGELSAAPPCTSSLQEHGPIDSLLSTLRSNSQSDERSVLTRPDELIMCAVHCDDADACERPNVFSLQSPHEWKVHLQASASSQRKKWIEALQWVISTLLARDTAGENLLQQLASIPGNDACFDCASANPQWAVISLGIMVCADCAGRVHRKLNNKVRSPLLDHGIWHESSVLALMHTTGNMWAKNVYGPPVRDKDEDAREELIMQKYALNTTAVPPFEQLRKAAEDGDAQQVLEAIALGAHPDDVPQPADLVQSAAASQSGATSAAIILNMRSALNSAAEEDLRRKCGLDAQLEPVEAEEYETRQG
jgi:hypothetical protein